MPRQHLDLATGSALPAALPVNTLACGSVAAAGLAAAALRGAERVHVDPRQVSVSFRNDQLQTVDGVHQPGFAPLSGFFEARDGWVRTHANYPHHRARLLRALGLAEEATRADAAAAIAERSAQEVEDLVTTTTASPCGSGPGRVARREQAAAVRAHPLLDVAVSTTRWTPSGGRSPGARKVLDLTRVLAGPVATRTLALARAATCCGSTARTCPSSRHCTSTPDSGKRSTLVDLQDEHARTRLHQLLDHADVLVTGYRPGALAAYHLDAESVAAQHPHVIHASLTAWTPSGPWGGRRGFDSIVQAATGISLIESRDGVTPGALPAQALDHATGYLLAAGVLTALRRRGEEGGTWRVEAHLARTAHWLLQTDALDEPAVPVDDLGPWTVGSDTAYGHVVQARPALRSTTPRGSSPGWGADTAPTRRPGRSAPKAWGWSADRTRTAARAGGRT